MKKWFAPMAAMMMVILMAGSALAGGISPLTQDNSWKGAPCLSDDDCGDSLKCCSSVCAESCVFSEFKISSNDTFTQNWFSNGFQINEGTIVD